MGAMLTPDTGLVIWTIVTFLLLVVILKVAAWKPLIAAIEAREGRMKSEREGAEKPCCIAQGLYRFYV